MPFGTVAYFEEAGELYHACEKLRESGYRLFDVHTPFPVHGLERVMGLAPSRVPWLALAGGIVGGLSGLLLTWWTMSVDYPHNIGGKPFFAFQAYVPIIFELTILLAAFGTFFGLWWLSGLPRPFHPVMQHPRFHRASDDLFFISIEATDPSYNKAAVHRLLDELHAREIEEVPE